MQAKDIVVKGIVQGVGFRPHVYRLADRLGLNGYVRNEARGVVIHLEGEGEVINRFLMELKDAPPPRARIVDVEVFESKNEGLSHFFIDFSVGEGERNVFISPDIATCEDCLRELFDPSDRRYRFPFINCTNCGPRFTITFDIPYDRKNTTMNEFEMCEDCSEEYNNPLSRRFHAQPNCCPLCGPELVILDRTGRKLRGDPIKRAASLLRDGRILVIKGLGGFHIACNALDEDAVVRIRNRKKRGKKPFALMGTMDMIREHCYVSKEEEVILLSPPAPIVLLKKRKSSNIPDAVAPGLKELGFMLPYTPVHHLLLSEIDFPLVMTSANISEEPIIFRDEEIERLTGIFDYILTHNRKIYIRADDSVGSVFKGEFYPIRRSRGYVPDPIEVPLYSDRVILGVGGDLKNTFCLLKGNYAIMSQYIGDMENIETEEAFFTALEHFKRIYSIEPEMVVCDMHPRYMTTGIAERFSLPVYRVQHHRAHMLSLLMENNTNERIICFAFDGTGYGEDGNVWGGEVFVGDLREQNRIYHLEYVPLPGGDAAIIRPWMYGISLLDFSNLGSLVRKIFKGHNVDIVRMMIENSINTVPCSSMGRLFDGVSAILNVSRESSYEGESAILLEQVAEGNPRVPYPFVLKDGIIEIRDIISGIVRDMERGLSPGEISMKFHMTVAEIILRISREVREKYGINRVGLTGGVFQNMLLLEKTVEHLNEEGFEILLHRKVPTNDGGIALGQVAFGVFLEEA